MRKPLLALLLIILPTAAPAIDMGVQLAGWKYGTQLLDSYPIRLKSQPIAHFEQKLDEVNRSVNAIPYVNDAVTYREEDVWQTPLQFYQVGGECRDYAIAKYHALYAMGVADADMMFVAVRIRKTGQLHAVLVVRHGGGTYILDNRHPDIRHSMAEYEPVYWINRLGWRTAQ